MRITSQMRRNTMLYDLERLQTDLYRAQSVLTDGREVQKASDDPVRGQKSLLLRSSLSRRNQYVRNLDFGMSRLSMAEASLMSVNDILSEARAKAVEIANDASVPEQREAVAVAINLILEDLVAQGNSREDDAYIFGGFNTEEAPYEVVRDPNTGDIQQVNGRQQLMDGEITVMADEGLEIKININGSDVFQTGAPTQSGDIFQVLVDLRDALRSDQSDQNNVIIEESITKIDDAMDLVQNAQTEIGGRYNRLQSIQNRHYEVEIREEDQLVDAEEGNLAEWLTRFELQSIALEQAMAVGTQVLNASIVNFIG
ncbi:hypothetical protein KQI52_00365 [bacterium]|nr:hypothetical protein [bacterium]